MEKLYESARICKKGEEAINACQPSISSEKNHSQRTKRTKIGKRSAKILKTWLRLHETYPYPTPEDLDELTEQTKLTEKQIRVWFTNYRNRKFSPKQRCLSKIKYVIQNKNFTDPKNHKSKDAIIEDTTVHFLSKYYCACDLKNDTEMLQKGPMSMIDRAAVFFRNAGYCTCDLNQMISQI